jgi:hypothetical protein
MTDHRNEHHQWDTVNRLGLLLAGPVDWKQFEDPPSSPSSPSSSSSSDSDNDNDAVAAETKRRKREMVWKRTEDTLRQLFLPTVPDS